MSGSDDDVETAAREGTIAAAESGTAVPVLADGEPVEVIVGEIPAAEDPSHMLWTARCSSPEHGLLGTFADRGGAQQARAEHLAQAHGVQSSPKA